MCTVAPILAAASLIGTGASIYMQSQAAGQQAEASNAATYYNSAIQQQNAAEAELQAQDALQRGEAQEADIRRAVATTQAEQRVGFAAAGVQVNAGGSVFDVAADTAYQGEEDVLTARHNAQLQARSFRAQAAGDRAQASLLESQIQSPSRARNTTLLSGASRLVGQGSDYAYQYGFGDKNGDGPHV